MIRAPISSATIGPRSHLMRSPARRNDRHANPRNIRVVYESAHLSRRLAVTSLTGLSLGGSATFGKPSQLDLEYCIVYPQRFAPRQMDRQKKRTSHWRNTSDATSTTHGMTGYSCCHRPGLHTIVPSTNLPGKHQCTPTMDTRLRYTAKPGVAAEQGGRQTRNP